MHLGFIFVTGKCDDYAANRGNANILWQIHEKECNAIGSAMSLAMLSWMHKQKLWISYSM